MMRAHAAQMHVSKLAQTVSLKVPCHNLLWPKLTMLSGS
jgi:hypothetical protein